MVHTQNHTQVHISREHVWSGGLEVGDHLVGVLVDLGELGGELLVLEGVAFLVEDLCQGGDEKQPLLGVDPGEVDGLAGGQLHGGALGFLASQVPEIDTIVLSEVSSKFTHMAETRRSAWRAALASVLRSSACPRSLEPLGESSMLVFFSVKNWTRRR